MLLACAGLKPQPLQSGPLEERAAELVRLVMVSPVAPGRISMGLYVKGLPSSENDHNDGLGLYR